MAFRHDFADAALKAMNATHRAILRVSNGRLLNSVFGMPSVELHTVGRRSGNAHSTMLTAPIVEDDRVVLVASKGGDDRDPDWFKNLQANPDVELTIDGRRREVRARVATSTERSEMWPQVVSAYKGYAGYQRRTDREIPLVICEPR
jgi:deazaflavin-dependent oxidoreductase (nitroreductase family)